MVRLLQDSSVLCFFSCCYLLLCEKEKEGGLVEESELKFGVEKADIEKEKNSMREGRLSGLSSLACMCYQ